MTGLTFVAPPPGLDPLVDFELTAVDGAAGLYSLRSVNAPDRRLFLLDPAVYVPGYAPEITDEQAASLKLTDPGDAAMFVVASPGSGGTTVNLLAPIIVNTATDMCAQVILEGQDYDVKTALAA